MNSPIVGDIKVIESRRHIYKACDDCGTLRWVECRRQSKVCRACNTQRGVACEKKRALDKYGFSSEDELNDIIREMHAKLMMDEDIAEVIGCERKAIQERRATLGLKPYGVGFPTYRDRLGVRLSSPEQEVFDGLMLGDGSISDHKRSANYAHNTSVRETLKIIREKLVSLQFSDIKEGVNKAHHKKDGEFIRESIKFSLKSLQYPVLHDEYKRWYGTGTKQVPQSVVLTPTTCYWWYIGDGCLPHRKGKSTSALYLCTHSFNDESKSILIRKMIDTIRLYKVSVVKSGDMKGALVIYGEDVLKFLQYIGPCKNPTYTYKWNYIAPAFYKNRTADDELPKTREEAKKIKCVAYYTGTSCENGHISRRYTNSGKCYRCANEQTRIWKSKQTEMST